jgi:hypothetical protein
MKNLTPQKILMVLLAQILCTTNISAALATPKSVTISGISSGGFMAAQMGVIYSEQISGVGLVAGGFYGCAGNHFQDMYQLAQINGTGDRALFLWGPMNPLYQALEICMKSPSLAQTNTEQVTDLYRKNLIADPKNLVRQKIYIYQGLNDKTVHPDMQLKTKDFYTALNVSSKNILLSQSEGAHTFPTDQKNLNSCSEEDVPYVSSCHKNVSGEILNFLIGPELQRTPLNLKNIYTVKQNLQKKPNSIADYGYVIANQYCVQNPEKCHLHVALHGCDMSDSYDKDFDAAYRQYALFGYLKMRTKSETPPLSRLPYIEQKINKMGLQQFVQHSGYGDYVEKNNVIVLFPQTQITVQSYPNNPKGCWDWYGATGEKYSTNQGSETKWLMSYISSIQKNIKKYIVTRNVSN